MLVCIVLCGSSVFERVCVCGAKKLRKIEREAGSCTRGRGIGLVNKRLHNTNLVGNLQGVIIL